jgi:hypothetical protein
MDGFGELEPEPEPEPAVAPGSVTGYRWWLYPAPADFRFSPAHAEDIWPHASLHGQRGPWEAGVNRAVCLAGVRNHDDEALPAKTCGCGFWAYWCPADRRLTQSGQLQVFGAIKGFGRTRIGTQGFRCAKARILAVHLACTLLPFVEATQDGWYDAFSQPDGHVVRTMDDGRKMLLPAGISHAQAQRAVDHAEAWLAVIGDRIEADYPGVTVCETRDRLLTGFPPDPVYARRFSPGGPGWSRPW